MREIATSCYSYSLPAVLYSALVLLASIEKVILVAKAGVVMQHLRAAGVFAIIFSVHEVRGYTTVCIYFFRYYRDRVGPPEIPEM